MDENYIRIKILGKNKTRTFKVKRFPVKIGSGKSDDIIPLRGDGIEKVHGEFSLKANKLFFEDKSKKGTRVNDNLVLKDKVLLMAGVNHFQIGRFKVVVQNLIATNNKSGSFFSKEKLFIIIPSALTLVLLIVAGILFLPSLFSVNQIEVKDFNISPSPLVLHQKLKLSEVEFVENYKADETIKYNLYFTSKQKGKQDTVTLTSANGLPIEFNLPQGYISTNENQQNVNISLNMTSENTEFEPILTKQFVIDNSEKIEVKDQVKFKSKISGPVFTYNVEGEFRRVTFNFGDGKTSKNSEGTHLYDNSGEYIVKVNVTTRNGNVDFERIVVVD